MRNQFFKLGLLSAACLVLGVSGCNVEQPLQVATGDYVSSFKVDGMT